jgi:transitional endoplasmic reticulum ATPase
MYPGNSPYPEKEGRPQILQIHMRSVPLAGYVNIVEILDNTDGFSGADIKNLIQKAGIFAIRRGISTSFQKDSIAEELLGQISINQEDLISGIEFVKSKIR